MILKYRVIQINSDKGILYKIQQRKRFLGFLWYYWSNYIYSFFDIIYEYTEASCAILACEYLQKEYQKKEDSKLKKKREERRVKQIKKSRNKEVFYLPEQASGQLSLAKDSSGQLSILKG